MNIRDRRTGMQFAHVVPSKGLAHEQQDLSKLGYYEVILNCIGEPALRSAQEEVQLRREAPIFVESSGVGDSQSNGAAEREVQSSGEQVGVLRHRLEARLGIKVRGIRPSIAWFVEHAADELSKCDVSTDGISSDERLKGKPCTHEAVAFGEKFHFKHPNGSSEIGGQVGKGRGEKGLYCRGILEDREAIVGTAGGIRRASSDQARRSSPKVGRRRTVGVQRLALELECRGRC